jgi:hypothetical protein
MNIKDENVHSLCRYFLISTQCHFPILSKEPINGIQARVPFHWSWKEDWKISMFLSRLANLTNW